MTRIRKAAVLAGAAAAAGGLLTFSPGRAQATTWVTCDNESPVVCLYADGVKNDYVVGKPEHLDWAGESSFATGLQAPNCPAGVSKVQDGADGDDNCNGVSEWWPFTIHQYDTDWDTAGTFKLGQVGGYCFTTEYGIGGNANILQEPCGSTGYEWVWQVKFVNVNASDGLNDGSVRVLCSHGDDHPMAVSTPGNCAWNNQVWTQAGS